MFAAHSDSMRNRVEFLMEAVLMADFDHKNVMWLTAIVIDDDMNPHVLLPLMELGDLRFFISKPSNVSIFIRTGKVSCTYYTMRYDTTVGM